MKSFTFEKIKDLKYGENPHQKAELYHYEKEIDKLILYGSELSYNEILNCSVALEVAVEFFDVAAAIIVHQANPCNVALSSNLSSAWDKILDSDPISPFNSVATFTKKINFEFAKKLKMLPLKIIIAPDFSSDALNELKKIENIKIIKINTPFEEILNFYNEEIKITPFGVLIQEKDKKELTPETFKVVTNKKPEQKEVEDMIFAFKVAKHVKSSAIVVAKDLRTLGICGGQMSSAKSLEHALQCVCDSPKNSIVASDTIFSTVDNIEIAAQNRISGIIQPSGSIKDKEIINAANKYGISMITTGIRHLKH